MKISTLSSAVPSTGFSGFLLLVLLSFGQVSTAQIWQNLTIRASDGVGLDATIARPFGFPPSGGFPGIVLVHGFGGSKDDMRTLAISLAAYGYASVAYSVRGQGNSGGVSTVDAGRERQDLLEVIGHFRSAFWIHPNKIGVTGGSQGGIHSWMAAVYRMPGVRVVAPLIATPDFARALVPNGCVTYGLPREMTLSSVRYSNERDRLRDFIIADQHDSVLSYIDARDLAHLVDSVRIPVMQGLGWADFLFPVNGGIVARARLAARHVPVWSYFGTNGHGESIDPVEAAYVLQRTVWWFDHWLKGFSLGQDSVPVVFYSDDRPGWPHHTTTTWPPLPFSILRLYITQSGLSQSPPPATATVPFTLAYDAGYTPAMGWNDLYGGPAFLAAFNTTGARFLSNVLSSSIEVTGTPTGRIFVQGNDPRFQAHVRFYDVIPADTGARWRLISRSNNGIRQHTPGQIREIAIEGRALSHIIPAGHRIGIEITSLDLLSDGQANAIPFFASSNSALVSSPSSPSFVDIPVRGAIPIEIEVARSSTKGVQVHNYPNPFNPTTTIQFSIDNSQLTSLKVYDALGREVRTLVNGVLEPGTYATTFDGSGLASGVYFYRLQTGASVETRRLVLLR